MSNNSLLLAVSKYKNYVPPINLANLMFAKHIKCLLNPFKLDLSSEINSNHFLEKNVGVKELECLN